MHFGYNSFLFESHTRLFVTLIFTSVIKQTLDTHLQGFMTSHPRKV